MNSKKIICTCGLFLSVCLLCHIALFAQQQPQFTQYMFNTSAVNPAYAGSRGVFSALSLYRMQWVGFDGAPATLMVNANTPVFNDRGGFGLSVINEKAGPVNQTGLYSDFVFKIRMRKAALSIGLKAGMDIFQANFTSLNILSSNDEQFQYNMHGKLLPNFGFGVYYKTDRFYIGLSTPKLVKNHIDLKNDNTSLTRLKISSMYYYFIAGYVLDMSAYVKFKPTVQVKYLKNNPISVDANASFLFHDKLWVGGMYRLNDAVGLLVQYQFTPQFRLGYSYDYTTSKLQKYNNGTHEIMIGFDLNSKNEKVLSPRYF